MFKVSKSHKITVDGNPHSMTAVILGIRLIFNGTVSKMHYHRECLYVKTFRRNGINIIVFLTKYIQ